MSLPQHKDVSSGFVPVLMDSRLDRESFFSYICRITLNVYGCKIIRENRLCPGRCRRRRNHLEGYVHCFSLLFHQCLRPHRGGRRGPDAGSPSVRRGDRPYDGRHSRQNPVPLGNLSALAHLRSHSAGRGLCPAAVYPGSGTGRQAHLCLHPLSADDGGVYSPLTGW